MKGKDVPEVVSNLVKIAAERSPKFFGDKTEIVLLDDAEKEMLAEEMFQLSDEFDEELYSVEGDHIGSSDKVVLLGLKNHSPFDIDCKSCGYENCEDFKSAEEKAKIFQGPNCTFGLLDLGMAIGYAWDSIESYKLQPNISIKGGLAAKHLGLIESRISLAITINVKASEDYPDFWSETRSVL